MKTKFLLSLTLFAITITIPLISFADIVTPGKPYRPRQIPVSHLFSILNLDEYPEYEFYVPGPTTPEEAEEKEIGENVIFLEAGKYILSPEKDPPYQSRLYARLRDSSKAAVASSILVGGRGPEMSQYSPRSSKDDYRIVSINDSTFVLELVNIDGRPIIKASKIPQPVKKGAVGSGIEIFGIDLVFFATPAVCFLGILLFVIYRRQSRRERA